MTGRGRDVVLAIALALLAGLYAWWFRHDRHLTAVLLVFVAPPLALLIGVLAQRSAARFWAGVLALFWFSHGVMSVWTHRETALFAWTGIVLALLIVALVSIPGMRARFAARKAR